MEGTNMKLGIALEILILDTEVQKERKKRVHYGYKQNPECVLRSDLFLNSL
jgi:hypothetical protein